MAGIYIHIPFCKSRCIYCDFYSTTLLERRDWYVSKLINEMSERSSWLPDAEYSTIYIGGGTPSQLSCSQLESVVRGLHEYFSVASGCEFTVEVNPDDVTPSFISHLAGLGVNRISMGVQTFSDGRLHFLHRRHTSAQALRAVEICKQAGIANISIDLMFGFPGQTLDEWKSDVSTALSLDVRHISAYSLMYEDGTLLTKMVQDGTLRELDEELSVKMYELLIDMTRDAEFQHYEISNFCKPGYHSHHNSGYWKGAHYIGLGAGAHSFDGTRRQWNGPMTDGGWEVEGYEILTPRQMFNEKIMTGLRTSHGVDIEQLRNQFPRYFQAVQPEMERYVRDGKLQTNRDLNRLTLSRRGILVSNAIMADLMVAED